MKILEESGIGLPSYYRWRTRSGCFFCFFQRKYEWVRLAEEHPDMFAPAVAYEQSHRDGQAASTRGGNGQPQSTAAAGTAASGKVTATPSG